MFFHKSSSFHSFNPGFRMIATIGDTSLRQARGHIGEVCDKWKHFLNDFVGFVDQMGIVRGHMGRVELYSTLSTIAD